MNFIKIGNKQLININTITRISSDIGIIFKNHVVINYVCGRREIYAEETDIHEYKDAIKLFDKISKRVDKKNGIQQLYTNYTST